MAIRIVQVDAFTNQAFAGNPAAVCVLRDTPSEQWMKNVAREMNLSETAFLVPQNGGFNLRWFTPSVEVALCGHATVASAHVLWQDGHLPADRQAQFHTLSGLLTADRRGEWIELDFPSKIAAAAEAPPELLPALGIAEARFVGKNVFDYLVEIDSEAAFDSVVRQKADGAFFLNPPSIRDVERVSDAGATMPEKSTYFFPKLLTGLVMNPLSD